MGLKLHSYKLESLNAFWGKEQYNRNAISFSVGKIPFIFLMTPIDSNNDRNMWVKLFKATFTQ